MTEPTDNNDLDSPPPFWGSWRTIYMVVAGLLFAEALVFWLLTKWAS